MIKNGDLPASVVNTPTLMLREHKDDILAAKNLNFSKSFSKKRRPNLI